VYLEGKEPCGTSRQPALASVPCSLEPLESTKPPELTDYDFDKKENRVNDKQSDDPRLAFHVGNVARIEMSREFPFDCYNLMTVRIKDRIDTLLL